MPTPANTANKTGLSTTAKAVAAGAVAGAAVVAATSNHAAAPTAAPVAAKTTAATGSTQPLIGPPAPATVSDTKAQTAPAETKITPGTKANTAATPGRPVASAIVQSSAHIDDQVTYQYNALGRRDPFMSLLTGEYQGAAEGEVPPDVGGLKVVGIVWGDADQFALVEDVRGDSHILRKGDKVMNGYVEALKRDAMIVNLTVDGQSQSVSVPLTRKGEKINANR
jgi:hypothetical protein